MSRLIRVAANPVFAPVHRSRRRYVVLRGSAGSGKSMDTAQMYVVRLMTEPGRNLLCVRKIEEANRASTFPELCGAIRRLGVSDLWEETTSPLSLRCRLNGNAVAFRGLLDERQREKLKSITFPGGKLTDIWVEEATELEPADLELLDDRLRGRLPEPLFYQIKLTFNPVSDTHWLKKRFFDPQNSAEFCRDTSVLTNHSTYLDNRFIDAGFHARMARRRELDPDGYRVYGLGQWGTAGGHYFSEWRESVHIAPAFTIPAHWRRYIALDYGLDMLAAYGIALDGQGRAWVYREVYESGLIISQAARRILAAFQGEDLYQCFAPPDLWNRRQDTGKSAADLFAEQGLTLTRADNDRVAGWYNLKEWLKPYRGEDGTETAALRIFPNCDNLIRTLPALRRDKKNPNDTADEPHELTHAPDALRYFLAGRPAPAHAAPALYTKLTERMFQKEVRY